MSAQSAIIKFGFKDHVEFQDVKAKILKHSAICKFCQSKLTERAGTSSAFTRYLHRVHKSKQVHV